MSSYIVNQIVNIESKRYLELGIYHGHNFNAVISRDKTSVDNQFPADFRGTTDDFFAQLDSDEKFDVVYIDACHQAESVVRDFNNTLKHLNPGGLILVHDLIPDTEELTAPHFCGDGFRVLAQILTSQRDEFTIFSLNSDYGLSVFVYPVHSIAFDSANPITYTEFQEVLKSHKVYSRSELQDIVGRIGHEPKKKSVPKKDTSNRRSRVYRTGASKKPAPKK